MNCAALFSMSGWAGRERCICTGDNAVNVLFRFMQKQDLFCLLQMGRAMDSQSAQKDLDKIECLLNAYQEETLEMKDLRTLDVYLQSGSISCDAIAETDEDVEKLIASYPDVEVLYI